MSVKKAHPYRLLDIERYAEEVVIDINDKLRRFRSVYPVRDCYLESRLIVLKNHSNQRIYKRVQNLYSMLEKKIQKEDEI